MRSVATAGHLDVFTSRSLCLCTAGSFTRLTELYGPLTAVVANNERQRGLPSHIVTDGACVRAGYKKSVLPHGGTCET